MLQMGGKYPQSTLCFVTFCLKRYDRHVLLICAQINSLQDSIDFMTLTSRDLSRYDVILAILIGEIHLK